MDRPQPGEIDIATIDHIDAIGLNGYLRYRLDIDIVHLTIGDGEKGRDIAAQVDHCVQFDRTLGLAEPRPGE